MKASRVSHLLQQALRTLQELGLATAGPCLGVASNA